MLDTGKEAGAKSAKSSLSVWLFKEVAEDSLHLAAGILIGSFHLWMAVEALVEMAPERGIP